MADHTTYDQPEPGEPDDDCYEGLHDWTHTTVSTCEDCGLRRTIHHNQNRPASAQDTQQ